MKEWEKRDLSNITLAPWIQKATALIGCRRKVGGNQFRHSMATMAILIDYHYVDAVLLKAALIHDLIEDYKETNIEELKLVDADGPMVVKLVLEVTNYSKSKREFLIKIADTCSEKAKILKIADRISNLTDLHRKVFNNANVLKNILETKDFVLPMARKVNKNMSIELEDLIHQRFKTLPLWYKILKWKFSI